eukprot:2939620-Prymnesium_polylepis.2
MVDCNHCLLRHVLHSSAVCDAGGAESTRAPRDARLATATRVDAPRPDLAQHARCGRHRPRSRALGCGARRPGL